MTEEKRKSSFAKASPSANASGDKPEDKKKILRKFEGTVVSDKMDKTVVVKVDRKVTHKKYKKKYTVSRRYKCHDEKNQYKVGDKVIFAECRPLSRGKRWRVVKKVL